MKQTGKLIKLTDADLVVGKFFPVTLFEMRQSVKKYSDQKHFEVYSRVEFSRKQKKEFSELTLNVAHAEDDDFETKPPARKKQDSADSHFNGD